MLGVGDIATSEVEKISVFLMVINWWKEMNSKPLKKYIIKVDFRYAKFPEKK